MAEADLPPQRRSSSQTSSSSRKSQRAKAVRTRSQKRNSSSSNVTRTDLTSFPSLSPDTSPEGLLGQQASNRVLTQALLDGSVNGGDTDASRGRKATLASLTSTYRSASGRAALFDDAPPTHNFPGALHLADDAHIERLLASTGPVNLVRQFAQDLAARDAEISALRLRADARERELKKMLREAAVSNQDIERRLHMLENASAKATNADASGHKDDTSVVSLDGLMKQAMLEEVGSQIHANDFLEEEDSQLQATIRGQRHESDARSGRSSIDSGTARKRYSSIRGWQDYIFGSAPGSRKTSRASSIITDGGERDEESERRHVSGSMSNRRKPLDDQLFQPPPVSDGAGKRIMPQSNGDHGSVSSRKSSRSLASWTVKLFAGNSQSAREAVDDVDRHRSRAASSERQRVPSALSSTSKGGLTAVAALQRINSSANIPSKATSNAVGAVRTTPQPRRAAAASVSQGVNTDATTSNPTNIGPVEMDAILPLESRPPSLTQPFHYYRSTDLLTDRFGFIYDQRRKKRQREARQARNAYANRASRAETLSSFRIDASDDDEGDEGGLPTPSYAAVDSHRSDTPLSMEDAEGSATPGKRWQDYLRFPSRPTELLSHTPSAGPILSLVTGGGSSQPRSPPLVAVDKDGSVAVSASAPSSASTSTVVADHPEFAGVRVDETTGSSTSATVSESEPVKLLLDQLTELHDTFQRERTVRWNEFLRKVRAERRKEGEAAAAAAAATATASDRPVKAADMPEASLTDGEVVGITNLGNKGKVGRAKWREFRSLVLGGIPVALRAKIWAECSGASAMRIPGYYEDLVRGVGGTEPDAAVVAQIDMDIHRTLTDNIFFRKGPGVSKLREVLLAYSRRNPDVGYCQGMNLIAASLLLITPTAEDTFWLLTSMIEVILPQHYYDHGLLASRADQVVLRQYIAQVLPKLSAHLDALGVELEALTFQWFLSVFTDCLSAEALYRVWDVVLCLNVSSGAIGPGGSAGASGSNSTPTEQQAVSGSSSTTPVGAAATATTSDDNAAGSGGGSTFLFQVALALLKLNEQQLLTTCSTPAALYTYINHQMTNHAISIDGLIQASEALRNVVRREDVVARRALALREMREPGGGDHRRVSESTTT